MTNDDSEAIWVSLEAECPYNMWSDHFNLVICLFDVRGTLLSHLTTEDPVQHPRVQIISVDHVAENKRRRMIRVNMLAATNKANSPVAVMSFGIFIPPPRPLEDFENLGHGIVNLKVEGRPILDFPLGYAKKMNAQLLGSLYRDMQDLPLSAFSIDPTTLSPWVVKICPILKQWLFRFPTTTTIGYVEDMLDMMIDEFSANEPLIKHEALNGCLPILRLLVSPSPIDAEQKLTLSIDQVVPDPLLTREFTPRGNHARNVLELPFDRLGRDVHHLWSRLNINDENLRDLWSLLATLKTEIEVHDNELALTAKLTQRVDAFESLLLNMYNGSSRMAKNMREILALLNPENVNVCIKSHLVDLYQSAMTGCQRHTDLCEKEVLQMLEQLDNYVEAERELETAYRRRDLYRRKPEISSMATTKESRVMHMMDRIITQPTVKTLNCSLGRTVGHVNEIPLRWPLSLSASLTLPYNE